MEIGLLAVVLVIVVVAIYLFVEVKRFRHKLFALFLIALVLFFTLSAIYVFKGKEADFGSVHGIVDAGKIYFGWMGYAFSNVKLITTNAINMDWGSNSTEQ